MTNPYARPEHPDSPQQWDSPQQPGPSTAGDAGRPDPWAAGYNPAANQYGTGPSNYSNPTVGMPQPAPSPTRPNLPPTAQPQPAPVYEQPPQGYSPYGQPQDTGPLVPTGYPASGYPGAAPALPEHPNAVATLVLGVVGFLFPLTFPIAWYLGAKGARETRNNPGRWRSSPMMTVGMVLGIVGTVLMLLGIAAFTLFVLFLVAAA